MTPAELNTAVGRLSYLIKKTASFHLLSAGWYFGRSPKISGAAIDFAIHAVKKANALDLWQGNVFPRMEGGVQIDFLQNGHEIEISIDADGSATFLHDLGDETIEWQEGLPLSTTIDLLKASAKLCISGPSTPNTLMRPTTDSAALHANPQVMAGYLLSGSNAHWLIQGAIQSAHIYDSIILSQSSPIHQYIGELRTELAQTTSIGFLSQALPLMTLATPTGNHLLASPLAHSRSGS